MARPANHDLNRLTLHITLQQIAGSVADGFSAVFLYRQGLKPAAIFVAIGVIFALRFALRPAALAVARRTGLKTTLIVGVSLYALQAALLAPVREVGIALAAYLAVAALAGVFYWPTYHAMFATVGDAERRGVQIGLRQALIAAAGIAGPAAGGLALTFGGPGLAFGAAAAIALVSIAPLIGCADRPIARVAPAGATAPRGAARCCSSATVGSSVAPAGPGGWSCSRRSAPASTLSARRSPRRRWRAQSAGWFSAA